MEEIKKTNRFVSRTKQREYIYPRKYMGKIKIKSKYSSVSRKIDVIRFESFIKIYTLLKLNLKL